MDIKVAVLLSSYNGEKYIEEQIDSILAQSLKNIVLYIRDDGSKDGTVSILKKYESNPQIKIEYGENMGFFASFLWLLNHCEKSDYYAFADQDDHWYPDKLEIAVKNLRKTANKPVVYCCNMNFCDDNMQHAVKQMVKYPFSIEKTIINGECGYGFTQVFNNATRDLILGKEAPKSYKIIAHDAWIHLLCLACGSVIYDENVHADMRRHGGNTSIHEYHGGTWWKHQIWRVSEFFIKGNGKEIYKEIDIFFDTFKYVLPNRAKKIIKFYVTPGHRVKKAFYPQRYRDNLVDEVLLRFLFLIGKM